MAQKESFVGTIASVDYISTGKTGWRKFEIAFEDGRIEECLIAKDNRYEPEPGDQIRIWEGPNAGWIVDKDSPIQDDAPRRGSSSNRNGRSTTPSRSTNTGRKATSSSRNTRDEEEDDDVTVETKSRKSNYASKSSESNYTNNDYWVDKTEREKAWQEYQMDERDPKIEIQAYCAMTMAVYAAAIPTLKTPPKTTQEIDAYIDDAMAKARAVMNSNNKRR